MSYTVTRKRLGQSEVIQRKIINYGQAVNLAASLEAEQPCIVDVEWDGDPKESPYLCEFPGNLS